MAANDDIVALAKLFVRQTKIIDLMTQAIADQSFLLVGLLPKCECGKPATMQHKLVKDFVRCDRCAAEHAVKNNDHDGVDWIDSPDADRTRRIVVYTNALKELSSPEPSVH